MNEQLRNAVFRGSWVEALFLATAMGHGLVVFLPWVEYGAIDFIVVDHGRLARVQVKSTCSERNDPGPSWIVNMTGKAGRLYSAGDFDFLAVYVIPENAWYIVPARLTADKSTIYIRPQCAKNKYHPYLEAWHLLKQPPAVICRSAAEVAAQPPLASR